MTKEFKPYEDYRADVAGLATEFDAAEPLGLRWTRGHLAEELPRLSERFEVKNIVEERINQLPVIKVEELLLGVMREHFTYINIFGALVGALIGVFQVLLFHFAGR